MSFTLQHGIEHEEDNSVSAERFCGDFSYGDSYEDALQALSAHTLTQGHSLVRLNGGLFYHLPFVEGVFREEWLDGNKQQKAQIWLIRRLTAAVN